MATRGYCYSVHMASRIPERGRVAALIEGFEKVVDEEKAEPPSGCSKGAST